MNETSKAMRRRFIEDKTDVFPWMKLFRGRGIDIGCGPDKLPFDKCVGYDQGDGDANLLTGNGEYSYVHASQCLEHMRDPSASLENWATLVRKGGHLIISVPDWTLYEGQIWPSRFNPDHKSTWSLHVKTTPAPVHVFVPEWLKQFANLKVVRCKLIDTNYNYWIGATNDQTYHEDASVEAFIEFVLQKK